jgi:tetratricopeptide (TPR) repeat protein
MPVAKAVIPIPPLAHHLVGRDAVLADLAADLISGQTRLIALRGLPGSGKTALALALANRADIAKAFPDGRAWLQLGPEPNLFWTLGRLLEQFGVPSKDLPDAETRTDRLRTDLAGKRYLLVLDDVWAAGDAKPFLEAVQPPAAAVFTTRNRQIVADLSAAEREISDLDAEAAIEMLAAAGSHAAAAVAADREASQALIQRTGTLPLALHVASRRLERLARADGAPGAAARLLEELSAQASRILEWQTAEGREGLKDAEPSLAAIIQLSYDSLPTPRAQRAFRCLAVFGGQPLTFDEAAMAAVWEADKYTATDLRLALADAGLLERVEIGFDGENEESAPLPRIEPQHALHQVIAMFAAAELATEPDEAYAAHLAHARYYAGTISADDNSMIAGDLAALARLDLSLGQVRRAIAWAEEQNTPEARQALRDLVIAMRNYAIEARTLYAEYDAWLAPALTACRTLNDPRGEALLLKAQGDTLLKTEQREEAEGWYREALIQAKRIGDKKAAADALLALGGLAQFRGQLSDAREAYQLALDLYVDVESRHGQANALADIGSVLAFERRFEEADSRYATALTLYREVGDLLGQANMLQAQGDALYFREQTETVSAALERYAAASDLYRVLGNPQYQATVLHAQGDALAFLGRHREALSSLEKALRMNRELGSPLGEANVLAAIGKVLLVEGRQERADQLLDEAIAIYEQVGDPYSIAARIGDYGWALHYAGQPDRARPYFLRAAELFDEYGYPEYATRHREMVEK